MFTGIIEEQGEIRAFEPGGDGSARITVHAPVAVSDARHGDSISVAGVCLTVVDQGADWFTADVMGQTLAVTALADVRIGSVVTLERAARVGDRLGGHIVQGHVDGVGTLTDRRDLESWRVLRFAIDRELAPLLVDKGSVTVAGVSLTVSAVSDPGGDDWFEVSLIPETLTATTLGSLQSGDRVNVETDVLARHVRRMLAFEPAIAAPFAGATEGSVR
jgi:riboflavin synthase